MIKKVNNTVLWIYVIRDLERSRKSWNVLRKKIAKIKSKRVIKRKGDKPLIGKAAIILLTAGLIRNI